MAAFSFRFQIPFSLCVRTCVSAALYEDTSPVGLGLYPMTSLNLNYLVKGLVSKFFGSRASTCELGEHNSVYTT